MIFFVKKLVRMAFWVVNLPLRFLVSRLAFIRNRGEWGRFVRGKTVCIVGPAPLSRDFEEEIEAHDIIIRVGAEHWPWLGTGSRTDVWVLDGGGTRDFMDLAANPFSAPATSAAGGYETRSFLRTLEGVAPLSVTWLMFKSPPRSFSELVRSIQSKTLGGFEQKLIVARKPIFLALRGLESRASRTNLNQIPLVLLELFLLRPKMVSVYGSDYYTRSQNAYGEGSPSYEQQKSDGVIFIEEMLKSHPQQHQRQVVLWVRNKRGWPGGDPDFIRLTQMDDEEFNKLFDSWAGSESPQGR